MGKITGIHGLNGWVKVFSYTQPRTNLIGYRPLYLNSQDDWHPVEIQGGHSQGKGLILSIRGYDNRATVVSLLGCNLGVRREQLPPLPSGEYYWADLEDLRVIAQDGADLGRVQRLFETGANAVLVVAGDRERLIPFLQGSVITKIDPANGLIQVNWDPTF